jgi:class 3 adenylate cyclase
VPPLLTAEQLKQIQRLRFPQPLESEFWLDWAERIRRPVRLIAGAGLGLCAFFLIATYLLFPDTETRLTNTWSVAAVVPILVASFFLTRMRVWATANPGLLWTILLAMAFTNGYGMIARDQVAYERTIIGNWMFFSVILIGSGLALFRSAAVGVAILLGTYFFFGVWLRPLTEPARTANWMIIIQTAFFAMISAYVAESRARLGFLLGRLLEAERTKTEELLSNVLPTEIARKLMERPGVLAQRHEDASVLFLDIVDFTPFAASLSPEELVGFLDRMFTRFDEIVERHGLEKIKTVGDAYMVAGGVLHEQSNHLESMAMLSLDLLEASRAADIRVRIGLHSGPLVAGVIGRKKFLFDLWGEAVNTASRMESHALPNRIQVTTAVAHRLHGSFEVEKRGVIEVKGMGQVETFWLLGKRRPEAAIDPQTASTTAT